LSHEDSGHKEEPVDQDTEGDVAALLVDEKKRSEELLTRLKYLQADFENYRKRIEKEIKEVEEYSVRSLVLKLLSVVDELELAVEHAEAEKARSDLKEGVKMVRKNMMSALESAGLKRMEVVGKPFDPSLHEAAEKVQGKSSKEDIVVQEIRAGYTFRGQVIRPAMVKVELGTKVPDEEAKASE
jgi:molecular chaperone GrpE